MASAISGGAPRSPAALVADTGETCRVRKLGVGAMPGSGSPEELIRWAGIDADAIATATRELVGARATA